MRRWPTRNNHSITHILNFALDKTFGNGVDQKGSLVSLEKTRFDYSAKVSSPSFFTFVLLIVQIAPTIDQIASIEKICNEMIKKNLTVYTKQVPLAQAKSIHGLRAVFGETYPDPVRVVSMGFDVDEILKDVGNVKWAESSIEFCGGT